MFVEDAEEALLQKKRPGSDSTAVSTILNITDGFLADVLQLTVFCTFNSRYDQIDHALTKKGRILVKYEFKELCASKVADIVGDCLNDSDIEKEMTIAEAFNYEASHNNMETVKIGFSKTTAPLLCFTSNCCCYDLWNYDLCCHWFCHSNFFRRL